MIEKINAVDRVPYNVLDNGAIRYGVYDENGKLLRYEYIKREDEPVEVGTNVNKVLFDKIDNNFLTEKAERMRVDRYNVPTYTKTETKQIIQGDIIPKTWEKINVNTFQNGDIKITGNGNRYNYNLIDCAFDGNDGSYWSANNGTETYIIVDFNKLEKIKKIKFYITQVSGTVRIDGSNDNEIWDELRANTSYPSSGESEIDLTNLGYYRYYKITFNHNAGYPRVHEIQVLEYEGDVDTNLLSLNSTEFEKITQYENNSIVNIQIPDTVVLYERDIIPKTWTYVADNHWNSGNFEIFGTFPVVGDTVNNAVDGDLSTKGAAGIGTGNFTIKFDKARKITKFNTFITAFGSSSWKIQGSNDNSSWVDLLEVNGSDSGLTEHILNNPNYYLYYRFYQGYYFYEIQTKEYEGTFELDPNNPSYLSINNLEPKEINFTDIIHIGDNYHLIYNGINFEAVKANNKIIKKLLTINKSIASGVSTHTITEIVNTEYDIIKVNMNYQNVYYDDKIVLNGTNILSKNTTGTTTTATSTTNALTIHSGTRETSYGTLLLMLEIDTKRKIFTYKVLAERESKVYYIGFGKFESLTSLVITQGRSGESYPTALTPSIKLEVIGEKVVQ